MAYRRVSRGSIHAVCERLQADGQVFNFTPEMLRPSLPLPDCYGRYHAANSRARRLIATHADDRGILLRTLHARVDRPGSSCGTFSVESGRRGIRLWGNRAAREVNPFPIHRVAYNV
jgi:hypothetical protein